MATPDKSRGRYLRKKKLRSGPSAGKCQVQASAGAAELRIHRLLRLPHRDHDEVSPARLDANSGGGGGWVGLGGWVWVGGWVGGVWGYEVASTN